MIVEDGKRASWRGALRTGCLIGLGVALAPFLLVAGCTGVLALDSATCRKADPVLVKIRDTHHAIPAGLEPDFTQTFPGKRIKTFYLGGREVYCPGSKRPVVQRAVAFHQLGERPLARYPDVARPGVGSIFFLELDGEGPRIVMTLGANETPGPLLFGRATIKDCSNGSYPNPGRNCQITGWTPDGGGVSLRVSPATDDTVAGAVQATEALLKALEVKPNPDDRGQASPTV